MECAEKKGAAILKMEEKWYVAKVRFLSCYE
jgi:hypothetical protein